MLLTDADGAPAPLPLSGVRVIDLSRIGPGPFCAALLGDLGADVTVVERVDPDDAKIQTSVAELGGPNLWLRDARRRTRRIGVDLKSPDGRKILCRLAANADVVIEGFRPGVAARLGVEYQSLSKLNQRLIYCSISGYGQTGPHASRPGHDINYIAEAGLLGLTGPADGPPIMPGVLVADFAAGSLYAASGILGALAGRTATGRGCHIDVSMHEAVVQVMARFIVPFLEEGRVYERGRSYLLGSNAWYNVHETADEQYVAVGAMEDTFFAQLARRLEHPEWVAQRGDPAGEEALSVELPRVIRRRSREEILERLGDEACVSPVATVPDVVGDPQLVHRGVFTACGSADANGHARIGAMVRGSDPRVDHQETEDESGRHTDAILSEAGYDAEARQDLRHAGVVG